jgi:hypothetical protein
MTDASSSSTSRIRVGAPQSFAIVLLVAGPDRGGDRHVQCELAFGGDVELNCIDRFERAQVVGHASPPDLEVDSRTTKPGQARPVPLA